MADSELADYLAQLSKTSATNYSVQPGRGPYDAPVAPPVPLDRPRVYITGKPAEAPAEDASPYAPPAAKKEKGLPPESWSPEAVPAGPAPAAPSLAEDLSRSSVLPPQPPPGEQPLTLGNSTTTWTPPTGAEARTRNMSPSERITSGVQDAIIAAGAHPYVAGDLATKLMNLVQLTPAGVPLGAADAIHAKNQGNITGTVMGMAGMIPGAKPAAKTAKAVVEEALPAAKQAATSIGDKLAEAVPGIGHNMPPSPIAATPPTSPPGVTVPKLGKISRSTELPEIRDMPRDEAIAYARQQPHLIKSGETAEGYYVGGPRNLNSKRGLTNRRNAFDAYVGADPRGGDWYDRYRNYLNEVTGGNPEHIDWMRKQEGQWSAGVDPASEQHFALKENNAALAGMPTRANYPAQHEAFMRAVAANNPNLMQLGDKTGEYADLINSIRPNYVGATGVNDFRHARNWGYTETSGEPQRGAVGPAGHKFLDYETALAVDRANKANLGGRSDWTGEQLQAAPWVRQKALDLMSRNKNLSYDEAFQRANKTIADFADRHTAYATYEAQPGAFNAGHMPLSADASTGERLAYASDPKSQWHDTPHNRDAIYGGMELPGTPGVAMRVRSSIPMQGMYEGAKGLETNPGMAARPLVTFDTDKGAFKTITPHDAAILNAGEATRAYVDAQGGGAWHKPWFGGPARESQSLFFPKSGPSTPAELQALQTRAAPHGLPNAADTGEGITSTRWWPQPEVPAKGQPDTLGSALRKAVFKDAVPGSEPRRAKVDSGLVDYSDKWTQGTGSGAATRELLQHINVTPEIRGALNNNGMIAQKAADRLMRDEQWAAKWGAPREDIQNARRIIGEGPGWVDRLEAALKAGKIALPAMVAMIGGAAALSGMQKQGGAADARS